MTLLEELESTARHAVVAAPRRRRPAMAIAALVVVAAIIGVWSAWSAPTTSGRVVARARHTPPDSAVRLYLRGRDEQRRRSREGAIASIALFERAIAIDSEYSDAWAGIARAALFAHNRSWTLLGRDADSLLSLAVRTSRRAVLLDSSSAEAWTIAGTLAGTVDPLDRSAALHALQRALALDSTYAEAWFAYGKALEEALRPAEAEAAWLRAAKLSPGNSQVLAFLGFHYLWYDNYPEGARWADSAVAVEPTLFLARDAAAFLALAMNRPEDAIRHAEAELRTRGYEPPIPPCLLAMASARQGDFRRARRYALDAEAVSTKPRPSSHEVVYLAEAWAAIGDTARAMRWIAAWPTPGDLHFALHVQRDPDLRWLAAKQRAASADRR